MLVAQRIAVKAVNIARLDESSDSANFRSSCEFSGSPHETLELLQIYDRSAAGNGRLLRPIPANRKGSARLSGERYAASPMPHLPLAPRNHLRQVRAFAH